MEYLIQHGLFTGLTQDVDKELSSTQQNHFYEWNWNFSVVLWNSPKLLVGFCLAKGNKNKIN